MKRNKQPLPATVESNPSGIRFELDDDEQNKESLKCTPATTYTHLRKVRRYLFDSLSFCDRFAVQWTWATHAMTCGAVPQRQPSWNNSNYNLSLCAGEWLWRMVRDQLSSLWPGGRVVEGWILHFLSAFQFVIAADENVSCLDCVLSVHAARGHDRVDHWRNTHRQFVRCVFCYLRKWR